MTNTSPELARKEREISYWVGQHRIEEREAAHARARLHMVTTAAANAGVDLDEAQMRDWYEDDIAWQLKTAHDAERLEQFRVGVVMVKHEAEDALRCGATDAQVLAAVMKAIDKAIKKERRNTKPMREIRVAAAARVAAIPRPEPVS